MRYAVLPMLGSEGCPPGMLRDAQDVAGEGCAVSGYPTTLPYMIERRGAGGVATATLDGIEWDIVARRMRPGGAVEEIRLAVIRCPCRAPVCTSGPSCYGFRSGNRLWAAHTVKACHNRRVAHLDIVEILDGLLARTRWSSLPVEKVAA